MTQDAKLYFPAKDPVFDSIPNMKKLFGTSAAAATPTGFYLLTHTAAIRDQGQEIGSGAAGGKFVLDVVGCMSVGPIDDTFKPDLALAGGVFEVETTGNAAAVAEVASAGHATVIANPLWGTEPNGNWGRTGFPAYLVYGYALGADVTVSGFDMGTIPQSISRPPFVDQTTANLFRVGLCIPAANGNKTVANRLVHDNAIVTGLFDPTSNQDQGASFCAGHVAAVTNSTWLQSFASSALSLISPKSAFAMQGFDLGIGGLPDGWSPIIPDAIPGSNVSLSFTTQPQNTFADTLFTVVVHASDGTNSLPGVSVTLSVDNNHGVPAGAIISGGNPTGTTDINGNVTLTIAVGKAGGFILAANGLWSAVGTQTGQSNQFQVQNK